MAKSEFKEQLDKFEEHMNVLRSAMRTSDTRLIAIAVARMALACLEFAVLPRFAEHAKDEWKRDRGMAFAKWLNGDAVEPTEFKRHG